MLEHEPARFVVHHRLEFELVFQRDGPRGGGSGGDLVVKPLQVREFRPGIVAQDEGDHARPAPDVHVHDRVYIPQNETGFGELRVENGEMPRGLELIAGVAVRDFLGREVLEMDRLAVALLSNTTTSPLTIAGTLPLGLTLRKSA